LRALGMWATVTVGVEVSDEVSSVVPKIMGLILNELSN